jgi:hypothetical protein
MFTAIDYYGVPYADCFYYVIVIFMHLGSCLCLLAFIGYNLFVVNYLFIYFFLTFNYCACYAEICSIKYWFNWVLEVTLLLPSFCTTGSTD